MARIFILLLAITATVINADDCPGGKVRCPGSMTCCPLGSGPKDFGCCPFPGAQCCKDKVHCCPHGEVCDLTHQACKIHGTDILLKWSVPLHAELLEPVEKPLDIKSEAAFEETNDIHVADPGGRCPDGKECLELFTCCKQKDNNYGCCHLQNAVCCTDNIRCCPQGYTCNTTLGTCDNQTTKMSLTATQFLDKVLPTAPPKKVSAKVICPDKKFVCPGQSTCCELTTPGVYGCCPYENAVCCGDHEHCCPYGYTCGEDGCERGNAAPWDAPKFIPKVSADILEEPRVLLL